MAWGYQEYKKIGLWRHFLNSVHAAMWLISWKNPAQTMFGFSPTSMRSSLGKLFWSYYIRLSMCAATASIDRIELRGPLTEIGTATSDKLKSKRFCGKLNIQIFSLRAGSFECIFWASDFTRSFTWLLITFVVNKARKFAHPFSARRNYHRQPKRTMCGFGLQRSFGRNILDF